MVYRRGSASIMPDSFPSCFGEHEALQFQMSGTTQNSVMCLYQITMAGHSRPVSVTWCKSFLGQGFSISIDDTSNQCMCRIDIKPWLFWRKQGSKAVSVEGKKMEVFWNLSSAKYVCGPEPQEGFYVAMVCEREIILFLGDMQKEALKKLKLDPSQMASTLLSKKEHLFGRKTYSTRAQFGEKGMTHDIAIECQTEGSKEPQLCVKVDKQAVVQVQHLLWKFRGNQTILVDNLQIEVFWDVHNWLFNSSHRHAVFMFQTCDSSNDKPWLKELGCSSLFQWSSFKDKDTKWFTESSCASVLQWPNSHSFKETSGKISSFSLLLYAWRHE
ncbi:hypothetical protein L7F22_041756 [Adiantum nelumboides]|nr:hypothetical protein [Adiantum nelumboides]